jgi:hypothetical protein
MYKIPLVRRRSALLVRRAGYAVLALAAMGCGGETTGLTTTTPISTSTACTGAAAISLSLNQAVTVSCASGTMLGLAGGAKYLIVPQLAGGGLTSGIPDSPVPYLIGPAVITPSGDVATANVLPLRSAPLSLTSWTATAQQRMDAAMQARERLAALAAGGAGVRASLSRSSSVGPSAAVVPAAGSLRNFFAISGSSLQASGFTTVTASLQYIGTNVLIYIDTLAPANGFTSAQLAAFGQYFDQTLYDIDLQAFGSPSDIDGNGHVIMLMSPTVNRLTPTNICETQGFVAGYFDGTDLLPGQDSNDGEIFYAAVPDPNGTVSCAHTVADLSETVPATFLHELQHLISFSQHVVVSGGNPEEGWLDEGMSIRAEELGSQYFEAKYPPPQERTDPSQIFPDSAQGFVDDFLSDSYAYLLEPDTASLTLHTDADDGFSWRGGDWALIHWLGDQKGNAIYTTLEHGHTTGIANITAAAGEPFAGLFGDFSLSLWTDSLVGVPRSSVPARDRFVTRNLRQLYARLFATDPGDPTVPRAYPVLPTTLTALLTRSMVPGTSSFYIVDATTTTGTVAIQFSTTAGTALPATLGPQVSVYRLPN